jgi:flavin reductase (DIM6/NTAB) family NADH-FMN oxidoreductase RutF
MPIDSDQFRPTLGRFPTGVTVVTFKLPDAGAFVEAPHGGVHGITVSSFISLSLLPPLVGVAIGQKSRAHSMLPGLARFGVSILAEDQVRISDHFAGRPIDLGSDALEELDGHPVVRGASAQLVCDIVNQVVIGDHTLVVGRVEQSQLSERPPLAYGRGRYGRLDLFG